MVEKTLFEKFWINFKYFDNLYFLIISYKTIWSVEHKLAN